MLSRLLTLVVLVGLAWWLWDFASTERSRELEVTSGPGALYPGLVVDDVTELYMQLDFGQDLLLRRERGGPWFIEEPTFEYARQGLIAQVLDNLARAESKLLPEERGAVSPSDIGLNPPEHMVRIRTGDETRTLLIGALDEFENMLFARWQGDPRVMLVTRNLVTFFGWHGQEWVDPSLLRGLKGDLTAMRIDTPRGTLLDARYEGGEWRLAGERAPLADGERIAQLARALQFVEADGVAATNVSPPALREVGLPLRADAERGELGNATRIEFVARGQEPAVVYLSVPDDQPASDVLYAVRHDYGKILTVPRAALAMLQNEPAFFRRRAILPPIRERAERLRILRDDDLLLDISLDGGAWTFAAPERLAGEVVESRRTEGRSPLGEVLFEVDGIEAVGFDLPQDDEVVTASLQVTWTRAGRTRNDRVDLLGEPFVDDGGKRLWLAKVSDRPAERLVLPADDVDPLLDPFVADRLRTLTPVTLEEAAYRSIEIVVPSAGEPLTAGLDASGTWVGDDQIAQRRALAEDLRRSGLRGYAWQPSGHSLTAWPYQVRYLDADGEDVLSVAFRRPTADEPQEAFGRPAALARVSGWPGVELVVPAEWLARLDVLTLPIRRVR